MTFEKKFDLLQKSVVKTFGQQCYRTLMVAYTEYSLEDWQQMEKEFANLQSPDEEKVEATHQTKYSQQVCDFIEKDLVMLGIFALMDPLRPGI